MLTGGQIKSFYEDGFFLLEGLFTTAEINEIRRHFDSLKKMAAEIRETQVYRGSHFVLKKHAIERVAWCCAAVPELLNYGEDGRLTRAASELLKSKTLQHLVCQAHYKIPGDMVSFKWHQDSENRRYGTELWTDVDGKGSYVQTIMAVDDMAHDNGPLLVLPKSNQLGHLHLYQLGTAVPKIRTEDQVEVQMQAGTVLFLHPFTVHSSQPNHSDRPRRVFINGFAYPGANRREYLGSGVGRIIHLP